MNKLNNGLEKEKKTIEIMIKKYCQHFHNTKSELCDNCSVLLKYSNNRLDNCHYLIKFGTKPICSKCPIHCYKPDMRKKIRKVMRYIGPRMMISHPIMGLNHLFHRFQKLNKIPKKIAT